MAKYDYDMRLFRADCGHEWVGFIVGDFTCPVCGLYDGDHHLISAEPIAVQANDFGTRSWADLAKVAEALKDGISED